MTRVTRFVTIVVAVASGCGGTDCVSLGYPSASVTAADAATRAVVSLAGASIVYTSNGRQPSPFSVPTEWPSGQAYTICCATGDLRIQLTLTGYAAVDTTVRIHTAGPCDVPVRRDVVLALRRTSAALPPPNQALLLTNEGDFGSGALAGARSPR